MVPAICWALISLALQPTSTLLASCRVWTQGLDGHLKVPQTGAIQYDWAREHNCGLHERTCLHAAQALRTPSPLRVEDRKHPLIQPVYQWNFSYGFVFVWFWVCFFLMKEGYRSFPEVTQPTSARTHLDLDKCQIKSKARIKIKHSLITQKLKNTCWAYLKYLNNTLSNCTLNCKIAFSISSMFPTQLKSSPGILNKDD